MNRVVVGLLCFVCCFLTIGCGSRNPSGEYVSHVRLPTGMELTETVDFKSNGICYFGTPPTIAECQWSHRETKSQFLVTASCSPSFNSTVNN
jgi:hypothetical protein